MKLPEPNLINKYPTPGHYTTEQMLAWGKANAEAEREACARLIEDEAWRLKKLAVDTNSSSTNTKAIQASNDADVIRARGNT